jgi:hypothetical protein
MFASIFDAYSAPIDVSCGLTRIKENVASSSRVNLKVDFNKSACIMDSQLNMEVCYGGDIGNFSMSAFGPSGLVSYVVSKYGSASAIPLKFELNSQVGEADFEREMIIASCSKN